jgi:hypothetical protein
MSYSIGLYISNGTEEAEIYDCGDYTYNVAPMYGKSMGDGGIRIIGDMTCKEALPHLERGIAEMINREEEMVKLNPPNGWGDFEGALAYLRIIRQGCEDHPTAIVRIY